MDVLDPFAPWRAAAAACAIWLAVFDDLSEGKFTGRAVVNDMSH
jgi:hypothetical protein